MKSLNFNQVRRLQEEQTPREHVEEEVGMVLGNLNALCDNTQEVLDMMLSGEINVDNGVEAWVVEKIALAHEAMETIKSYLMYNDNEEDENNEEDDNND